VRFIRLYAASRKLQDRAGQQPLLLIQAEGAPVLRDVCYLIQYLIPTTLTELGRTVDLSICSARRLIEQDNRFPGWLDACPSRSVRLASGT
jgi:hypothetical protein